MGFFSKLFGGKSRPAKDAPAASASASASASDADAEPGQDLEGLARRLGVPLADLQSTPIAYREIRIPKRDGSARILQAPEEPLKKVQRTILRRLLAKLAAHPAATGFEVGQSIATNALPHVGALVILKLDIKDFFTQTPADKIESYFRVIGWNRAAVKLLSSLTTYKGCLPQGAPTSPRLSNIVNYLLDQRLFVMALKLGAIYTRYADDLTFSFGHNGHPGMLRVMNPKTLEIKWKPCTADEQRSAIAAVLRLAKRIVEDEDYELHLKKKLRIASRHDRMVVTGLVVNDKLNLPRSTRRRLRAVEHHLAKGKPATLTPIQLRGWKALESMIASHQQT